MLMIKTIAMFKGICGFKTACGSVERLENTKLKSAGHSKSIIRRIAPMLAVLAVLTAILSFAGCGAGNAVKDSLKNTNTPGIEEPVAGTEIKCAQESAAPTGGGQGDAASKSEVGTADARDDDRKEGDSGQSSADGGKFPLKVTDASGYEMTVQEEPRRIISLTLGSDEILMGLVDKSRIASLTRYADDPGISNIAAEAAGVGERVTMDKVEKIISMEPDLVILDTWADANYIKQLRDAGINVYVFKTPSNIDEQMAVISEIAHVVGADEKGGEMIRWMKDKLESVEKKLSALKPEDRLTVMDYGEMGSSGLGTNFDDIVTRAGLVNVVAKAGMTGWPIVSKEKIIELDPDIIILPSWYYDKKNTLEGMINTLKSDKSLAGVGAIKNNRLISVPNPHISAISQYVVLGVEDVAKAAYPELFD